MAMTRAGVMLSIEEMERLLDAVPNPRYRLMLKVAYLHGLRVSEVVGLTTKNVKDGYLTVQRLKGSFKTVQPLQYSDTDLFNEGKELNALVLNTRLGEHLFPITRFGVNKLIKRAGRRAGIPDHKLFPHVLKHSIAQQTIKGVGIENVRQWLGHKSIASTGNYLRVTDEEAGRAINAALHVSGEERKQ